MYVNVISEKSPLVCCSENNILKSKDQEDDDSCSWNRIQIEPTLRIRLKVVNAWIISYEHSTALYHIISKNISQFFHLFCSFKM